MVNCVNLHNIYKSCFAQWWAEIVSLRICTLWSIVILYLFVYSAVLSKVKLYKLQIFQKFKFFYILLQKKAIKRRIVIQVPQNHLPKSSQHGIVKSVVKKDEKLAQIQYFCEQFGGPPFFTKSRPFHHFFITKTR